MIYVPLLHGAPKAILLRRVSQDITSNEVVVLCRAILRLLQAGLFKATLPGRSFADLLAHLVAGMTGEEAEEHSDLIILNSVFHAQPGFIDLLHQ